MSTPYYKLSDEAFELLSDTRNTLFLLGELATERNPNAGDISAAEVGTTLLRLSEQLVSVIADARNGRSRKMA